MAEPEGGHDACLRRPRRQIQGLAQPHQVFVAGQHRVHAVQCPVCRHLAGPQHLRQADHLEGGGTALRVAGQGFLRHHIQWVTRGPADGGGQPLVQVGFVRVVRRGGRVVLRNHRDVVHADTHLGELFPQPGFRAAPARAQRAQPGGGDGGVHAIGEGFGEPDHAQHRQAQVGSH